MVRALVGAGAQVLAPARRPDKATAGARRHRRRRGRRARPGRPGQRRGVRRRGARARSAPRPRDQQRRGDGLPRGARRPTGWELQLATNHLGHFALVNRLWPLLAGGARVVSVSSAGHHLSPDPLGRPGLRRRATTSGSPTASRRPPTCSSRCDLDRARQAEHGVRAFALHPGAILTPLGRHLRPEDVEEVLTYGATAKPVMPDFKSPEAGAATAVWAATSPLLDGLGGLYLEDCDVAVALQRAGPR